ncbi:hypothetical protein [Burkholderia sp. Bp8963]|uniref:hypothetical protein n=1 Tax=Burkholderia sp. Bp8963 TaxID=2184547 RepID=UPI0021AB92A9|nr:hypothetical protein [Burkholderia sp. Bp8963]
MDDEAEPSSPAAITLGDAAAQNAAAVIVTVMPSRFAGWRFSHADHACNCLAFIVPPFVEPASCRLLALPQFACRMRARRVSPHLATMGGDDRTPIRQTRCNFFGMQCASARRVRDTPFECGVRRRPSVRRRNGCRATLGCVHQLKDRLHQAMPPRRST